MISFRALLGAVLLWDFFVRVMHGVADHVLRRCLVAQLSERVCEPDVALGVHSWARPLEHCHQPRRLVVMLLLAFVVFGLQVASYGISAAAFVLVLLLFGIALGIVATAMVLRVGPAAEWLTWPIPAVISPFAGVFYPLNTLPEWMQRVGRILPPTYVFEGLRGAARGEAVSVTALAFSAGSALVYVAIASWFFQRVYRHAVQTGLIARYSAESLN